MLVAKKKKADEPLDNSLSSRSNTPVVSFTQLAKELARNLANVLAS